jgi:hypothetical protein
MHPDCAPGFITEHGGKYIKQLLGGHGSYVAAIQAVPLAAVLQRAVHVYCLTNTLTDHMFTDARVHVEVRNAARGTRHPITLA